MISSIDLFFRRDCALGAGPDVELPRPLAAGAASFVVVVSEFDAAPGVIVCEADALVIAVPNNVAPAAGAVVLGAAVPELVAVGAVEVDSVAAACFFWPMLPNTFVLGAAVAFVVPKRLFA